MTKRPEAVEAAIEHFKGNMPYFPMEMRLHLIPLLEHIKTLEQATPSYEAGFRAKDVIRHLLKIQKALNSGSPARAREFVDKAIIEFEGK